MRSLKTIFVYLGFIIGAGFASGREIMEYFNIPSGTNPSGIIIASFLFALTAYLIMSKSSRDGIYTFDEYIDSVAGRAAKPVKYFMLIYMFCGLFTMFAGSGALLYSLGPMSRLFGAVVAAAVCFFVISFDLRGVEVLNTILVPIMIGGILYVAVCGTVFGDTPAFNDCFPIGTRSGIILSAVCYGAYNTVTAGAVLVPLSGGESLKALRRRAVTAGFVAGILIFLVWTVQRVNFDILWKSELPMLELAAMCGKTCKRVYTAVLFMAICTTAVSYGYGILSHFRGIIKTRCERVTIAAVVCLAALPPAMYGFSNIVANLYSLFGYMGMAWILWIIIDALR